MRIAAVSDLHGHLSHSIPECDVLCIVGDIVPLYSSAENWKQAQELHWWETKFVRWLRRNMASSGASRCLVSGGNHDILLAATDTRGAAIEAAESVPGVTVLGSFAASNTVVHDGVRFSAYEHTPTIQDRTWAFSQRRSSPAVRLALDTLPTDTDVLLSHGPPQGFLDECPNGRVGCAQLMTWLVEHGPALTLCGHIHEQRGKRARYFDQTGTQRRIGNVSICDRDYSPRGAKVQVFDL